MDKVSFQKARELASKLFDENFVQIQRGLNNWVFEYSDRILTIPRHERVRDYSVRVASTKKLSSAGIPVAEILQYAPETEEGPEYLFVKKIEGSNVNLAELSLSGRKAVHYSAGQVLRVIHSINGEGYGRLDSSLIGKSSSWLDFSDSFFEESLRKLEKNKMLWDKYANILVKEYEKGKVLISSFSNPSFLHADFHLGNILFKNGKVAAVLDLDLVTSGDINWDTGHYCRTFNVDREQGIKSFRDGYGDSFNPEAERLYSLMIWTRKIASQAIQRPDALRETIPELERIIGRV